MSDGYTEGERLRRYKEQKDKAEKAHYDLETLYRRIGQMSSALHTLINQAHEIEKELT